MNAKFDINNLEGYFELENYGVKLKRLTHDKIEMLRQWRNDPKIQQYMFYRQEITPEMQERWFANLDKTRNFYFIIEVNGEEIGLINVKDIDHEKKCGEAGVFIYVDAYLSTDVAYRAHLVMFDYIYDSLKLSYTYSHILPDNPKAYRFAEFLGCKKDESSSNEKTLGYKLTADGYLTNVNRQRFIKKWFYFQNK